MPCRFFLPPSSVFIFAFLLMTISLPSIGGRAVVDHEETKGGDGKREKRELITAIGAGVVAGVIVGVIGKPVQDLLSDPNGVYPPSSGGCLWIGRAPFCSADCPSQFDSIREHNGRCGSGWFDDDCIPDSSFGKSCSTILGDKFKKRLCCKIDRNDCTWEGQWMDTNNAIMDCKFNYKEGRCGRVTCSANHRNPVSSLIGGEKCDRLEMWGYSGKVTCGYVAWFDSNQELRNRWYKTSLVG
uniref:Uncharacterized protein n=1 Tax=Plectus sambesii TaxID=2011161 RepID=A0A914X4V8_9BILA